MNGVAILTLLFLVPWLGALVVALWPRGNPRGARFVSLVFSLSTLVIGVAILEHFDRAMGAGFQCVENHPWITSLAVNYHLGLDGLSLVLVLLTGILSPLCLLASWRSQAAEHTSPHLFGALFLFLQGSAVGVFLALNFFLWFVFWELSLVPAFFLIKMWGGAGRTRAAYQFVIYTIAGSAFMLLGFAAIFASTGTLDFVALAHKGANGELAARLGGASTAVFLGVFIGLAVKVPLFPFHTWLPSAYAEAPTSASMFLTGVMSKMGVYGFLRILWPLFPQQLQRASGVLLVLALGGVVMGAFAAMAQRDLKRMVAYSSVNHVSYCLLALFALASAGITPAHEAANVAALNGAILQMFNHGLSAAALFFCVGVLEARSGGLRGLNDFGGVRKIAPIFAGFCGIAMFSSLGLPGLNGFVGEFLIFRGVFGLVPVAAAVSCLGLLATAIFLLTFYQRVFHGPPGGMVRTGSFCDLSRLEVVTLVPLIALMFVLGVAPQLLVSLVNPLVTAWTGGTP